MAKFVKELHTLVNFLAGKNSATRLAPEKIDTVLYEVLIDIFNGYYDNYVKTQKVSDYLLPFKKTKIVQLSDGKAELPGDYQLLRSLVTEVGKPIDIVEDKFWPGRASSVVAPPTAESPIARIEISDDNKKMLEVKPGIPKAILQYFRLPVKPVLAYTIQGSNYIYNDTDTVDIEFSQLLYPDITRRVLSMMGINIRDRDITIYAEQSKQTEQMK